MDIETRFEILFKEYQTLNTMYIKLLDEIHDLRLEKELWAEHDCKED